MYDFTSLDKTLHHLEKVRLQGVTHFYWPRGVVTLCLKDKRYQKPLWVAEVPVCPDCSAKLVEVVLKAREQRAA